MVNKSPDIIAPKTEPYVKAKKKKNRVLFSSFFIYSCAYIITKNHTNDDNNKTVYASISILKEIPKYKKLGNSKKITSSKAKG